MHSHYTRLLAWEAFRELVQNWRDAIIDSYDLEERKFRGLVKRQDNSQHRLIDVIYRVLDPDSQANGREEWLGYIRFQGTRGMGEVEIVNRRATLQPWHLKLGGTSKRHSKDQAGSHGEGFKLAILVMMPGLNHSVVCHSGGFKWKFDFNNNGDFCTRLIRMTPKMIDQVREDSKKSLRMGLIPFVASPQEDVKFIIGRAGPGNDSSGNKTSRGKVSLDQGGLVFR
ncbi:hypothetical protein F5B20DRAFT_15638 [Whalleya microplaca]|nr:hypothetical protein F5B20DRAFT_15638 [Whalleya microplaca]